MKVAKSLWAAEDAIDAALAKAAELNGALVHARCDANLSAIVGHDAFEGAAAALTAITNARGELVETHRRLTETKMQIGLRTVAIGDTDESRRWPPRKPTSGQSHEWTPAGLDRRAGACFGNGMPHSKYLFDTLLLLCCGYAWWRGGAPERIAAAIIFVGAILTHFAWTGWTGRWSGFEVSVFAVDLIVLAAFLALAVCAERFWTLWLTALHVIGIAGHLVKMADPALIQWGYAVLLAIWSYPMLILIALGTWEHRRRLARHGADRSWSSFSALSARRPLARPIG